MVTFFKDIFSVFFVFLCLVFLFLLGEFCSSDPMSMIRLSAVNFI